LSQTLNKNGQLFCTRSQCPSWTLLITKFHKHNKYDLLQKQGYATGYMNFWKKMKRITSTHWNPLYPRFPTPPHSKAGDITLEALFQLFRNPNYSVEAVTRPRNRRANPACPPAIIRPFTNNMAARPRPYIPGLMDTIIIRRPEFTTAHQKKFHKTRPLWRKNNCVPIVFISQRGGVDLSL